MKTSLMTLLVVIFSPAMAAAEGKPVKPVTVPFELLKSGHMAVQIKINGKGPYRVIFDTGAPVTLLNNKIAKEAGLLKDAEKPLFSLFGAMGQVSVKSLQVGEVKAANVSAIIMDHPTVEAISRVLGPIEGIVGFPFFARFKMTLDYQAKELTFVPNGFEPPDVMQTLMASMMIMGGNGKAPTQVIAPAGLWGMVIKDDESKGQAGVKVTKVYAGSAAALAGIKEGDRILTVDGRWTDTMSDLYAAAGHAKAGVETKVTIQRDENELEVKVKPTSGF